MLELCAQRLVTVLTHIAAAIRCSVHARRERTRRTPAEGNEPTQCVCHSGVAAATGVAPEVTRDAVGRRPPSIEPYHIVARTDKKESGAPAALAGTAVLKRNQNGAKCAHYGLRRWRRGGHWVTSSSCWCVLLHSVQRDCQRYHALWITFGVFFSYVKEKNAECSIVDSVSQQYACCSLATAFVNIAPPPELYIWHIVFFSSLITFALFAIPPHSFYLWTPTGS